LRQQSYRHESGRHGRSSQIAEFSSMNAIRVTVGVVSALLAAPTCAVAMAKIFDPPAQMSVGGMNSFDYDPIGAEVPVETSRVIPFFNRIARAWSRDDSVGGLPAPTPEVPSDARSLAAPQADVPNGWCEPTCERACPSVYYQLEALFLWRDDRLIDQPILVDANTGETFMSTSDLDFGVNYGVRQTFGVRMCGCRALEFSYFGLFQVSGSDVAVSPGAGAFLIFPDNFAGNVFVGLDRLRAEYSSRLNSLEANLPCCCGCCDDSCGECCEGCGDDCGCPEVRCQSYESFAGFRYIHIGEDLNLFAQRTVAGEVEQGNYDIHTSNDLYGLQLGGRTRRTRGRYGWEAMGKAGIFGSDARQRQSVTDFPDFPLRPTVSSSSFGVAFVGEAKLTALYRLTPIWNLRAGYTAMWIEGLALAPDQLDFDFASASGGSQLHNGGAILLHGVNVGIEGRW
jgi:hypothetical protein